MESSAFDSKVKDRIVQNVLIAYLNDFEGVTETTGMVAWILAQEDLSALREFVRSGWAMRYGLIR